MAKYAAMLGKTEDADRFQRAGGGAEDGVQREVLQPRTGPVRQRLADLVRAAAGLRPGARRTSAQRVFDHLVRKITDETHGHIGTGLIGGQFLNRVLSDRGRADLAYTIASQRTTRAGATWWSKGATTIWELWNGDTADPAMNSGNHVMLVGDLVIWLYEYLAGIRPDEDGGIGFKHIVMRPQPVGDLEFVKASLRSPYGLIASDWRKEGGMFDWRITVPANTTATVYVPAASADAVTEGGQTGRRGRGRQVRADGRWLRRVQGRQRQVSLCG